ncbi:Protodermal factor 1 [Acorus gramineus]|uniref:Protodermal factor 1 n=1 Tax=Acorus gramineus TaxID=55184 RepID=A0AAV9AYY4_ACOGR|nr:Protodermal factor 1 [Acorus gramineus]
MERGSKSHPAMVMWVLFVGLVSQSLVVPVASRSLEGVTEQKAYYPPDPHRSHSPRHSHRTPTCPTPSTPSHGTPTAPSHGGGYGTPSTPSHGGGYYNPPTYHPPSTPVVTPTPSTPTPPSAPYIDPGTPSTPTPPSAPYIDPGTPTTPGISTPPAPFLPGTPPFTCDYWRTHPALVWGIFGYWAPMAGIFQTGGNAAFGPTLNLPQALSNTRMDGIGALYREGTAALLNSMVSRTFHFTTQQVKEAFNSAVVSNNAAAAQARLFRKANEGH